MKTLRIPETDLARISPLSKDEKRVALHRLYFGVPPFSYDPVKHSWGDILNMQPGMFGPAPPTAWEEIEKAISRRSRPGAERNNNLSVAYALYERAISEGWRSKQHDIYPLTLPSGLKLEYWLRLVLVFEERPLVPHFDPRRSNLRLSEVGRRFAFSVMHERTRAVDLDLASARLGIFQFETTAGGGRRLRLHTDEGVALYPYEELEEMVSETYAIWREVCEEREAETRRRASRGGSTPFGF